MGILKDKTILYVTHQVEFLPAADLILVREMLQSLLSIFSHLRRITLSSGEFRTLNGRRISAGSKLNSIQNNRILVN